MRKLRFHPCGNFNDRYGQELTIFGTDFGRTALISGLVILFAVVPYVSGSYFLYILNTVAITAIAAIGLNILVGFTG
ncbi:MAG: hypothetical protein PHY29_05605, partial [Syntrophales bacterium]|nr:hypothetical protein [Syntrophales bacterium]